MKKPRWRSKQMPPEVKESEPTPQAPQQMPNLETMVNSILSTLIAKHQQSIYQQLVQLQKSLQTEPEKIDTNK